MAPLSMWYYLVGVTDTRQRESYTVVKGRRYVARLELLQRGLEKPLHKGVKGVKVNPSFSGEPRILEIVE